MKGHFRLKWFQLTTSAKKAAGEAQKTALEAAGVSKNTLEDLTYVGKSTLGDLTKSAKQVASKKGLLKVKYICNNFNSICAIL